MLSVSTSASGEHSLPPDWETDTLRSYMERPEYGHTASAMDDVSGSKFLRITDIQDGQVDWDKVPYCDSTPEAIKSKRLLTGDIVVARIGATTGKSFFIEACPESAIFASYLIRLRADASRLLPKYLYFYMQTQAYWFHIHQHKGDRLKGGVNIPALESLPIAVPPIGQQERIIQILGLIEAVRRCEERQQDNAVDLKRTLMNQMFTSGLRGEPQKETEIGPMPESWTPTPVGTLSIVRGGKRMPKGVALTEENTGRPYVRVTDFENHTVAIKQVLFIPRGLENAISRYTISKDDVYISIAGTIGLVGQVPENLNGANLTENAAKITVNSPDAFTRYLMYALASGACRQQITQATGKNAQPKLALARIEQIKVPLPTNVDEQREIVSILDAIDRKMDLHRRKRTVFEELFKSLLHKLMTGEICVSDFDLSALPAAAEATP